MVENSEKPKRNQKSVHEKHNLRWLLTPGCDFEFLAPCSLEACAMRLTALSDPHFLGFVIGNEEAVGLGDPLLYYPYDSHWNQAGHDLAAGVIAEALGDAGCGV